MEIIQSKRSTLSLVALTFGIVSIFVSIMEFIHVGLEEPMIFFFSTPGDAVFETSWLDHLMKGFVNLLIGAMFIYGYPKIREGTLEGFGFLIGAGILSLGIGMLFFTVWVANLIDVSLIGIAEPEIWEEFMFTEGIRLEWFMGIASIYILLVWKNRERYLIV